MRIQMENSEIIKTGNKTIFDKNKIKKRYFFQTPPMDKLIKNEKNKWCEKD